MRYVLAALMSALFVSQMSCTGRSVSRQRRWLTGTCPGACDYYITCKEQRGEHVKIGVFKACEDECSQVFSSAETILAFESLVCEDAIAFVEGPSGRQPGESLPGESLAGESLE